ncbi:MAG: FAD-dependent oxidoreductase [archaeon]|jgi:glutamate synthase (NADPH/NADH) small chain
MNAKETKKVAIIGSGPAGMVCANQLANAGIKVTIFEELKEFGGMLAYGIPEFRIPLQIVREKTLEAEEKGIVFHHKKVDSINKLLKENKGEFDFVVLAIGSGVGAKLGFRGEDHANVLDALHFLLHAKIENKNLVEKGEKVAVIGGGNSAIDAARVAVRQGGEVTILYRRTEAEMPASKLEIELAKKEGVKFEFLHAPKELICSVNNKTHNLICHEMILSEEDSSGRKKPIESGKHHGHEFNKIILAVGQTQDYFWLEKEGIKTDGKIILVDEKNKTTLNKVYACGDCVTGPKTIATATISGIKTAKAILELS